MTRAAFLVSRKRERGAVAVEYGIILPVFLVLALGLMDTGRLLWTQTSLDRAVEAAARCGVVDAIQCGTAAQVQQYAADQAYGLTIDASAFTVALQACGVNVTAEYPFDLIIPWLSVPQVTLRASGCYPV